MSTALEVWNGSSREALDEIERVHRGVAGVGRRVLARQVNYAYVAMIVAHFQMYCRAIHMEATQALAASVENPQLARALESLLGNPTPTNLGTDFGRFGFKFWEAVEARDQRNRSRKASLASLCEWRNAVVHGDIPRKRSQGKLNPTSLNLETCQGWRRSLGALSGSIDRVVADQCRTLGCTEPW
jgi:hypothetical protein